VTQCGPAVFRTFEKRHSILKNKIYGSNCQFPMRISGS
jgi:hypothetical protein